MDDATFLRNFANRDRVVLLAGGTAVPMPLSVMDDPTKAGATFRINLISPEGAESGDRRTFIPGTVDFRELPIPLMWQWQLGDGHKNAVVVGRIDYIEQTKMGLGNARGVFDNGPWGAEAERMVRNRMVRGISGDYSNFNATIIEKIDDRDKQILDDKISVISSKLVAATIVAKPAFEGCYIEVLDDLDADSFMLTLPDGIVEGLAPLTASALRSTLRNSPLMERLERLEALEREQLAITASAVSERVNAYRLEREREAAVARIRGARTIVAAWKPLSTNFLSAKAKLQPRDSKGRWIEMGSIVRWRGGSERTSGVERGGKLAQKDAPYKQGRVTSFNANTGEYEIEPLDGTPSVNLTGKNVEVVKAVIPQTPTEAQKLNSELDDATQKLLGNTDQQLGGKPQVNAPNVPAEAPKDDSSLDLFPDDESPIEGLESAPDTTPEVHAGLQHLNQILKAEAPAPDAPDVSKAPSESSRQIRKREKAESKDIVQQAEDARLWPSREELGRQMFNNLARPNETWEKDGEKYIRAADRLKRIGDSRLISKKRRGWIQNTYGKNAAPIPTKQERKNQAWSQAFTGNDPSLLALSDQNRGNEVGPLAHALSGMPNDAPTPNAPEANQPAGALAPETQDAVKVLGKAIADSIKEANKPAPTYETLTSLSDEQAKGKQLLEDTSRPHIQERAQGIFAQIKDAGGTDADAYQTLNDTLAHEVDVKLSNGDTIGVDKNIAPIVSALDKQGVPTVFSGDGTNGGRAYLVFKNPDDAAKFADQAGLTVKPAVSQDGANGSEYDFSQVSGTTAVSISTPRGEAIYMDPAQLPNIKLDAPDAAPTTAKVGEYDIDENGTVHLQKGQSVSLSNPPKAPKDWIELGFGRGANATRPPTAAQMDAEDARRFSGTAVPSRKQDALNKMNSGEMKFRGASPSAAAWTKVTESQRMKTLNQAKAMFENLHPDLSWEDADQTAWITAAQKAQETRNGA